MKCIVRPYPFCLRRLLSILHISSAVTVLLPVKLPSGILIRYRTHLLTARSLVLSCYIPQLLNDVDGLFL